MRPTSSKVEARGQHQKSASSWGRGDKVAATSRGDRARGSSAGQHAAVGSREAAAGSSSTREHHLPTRNSNPHEGKVK